MTTHELAKKLLERDDVLVVVEGYEGGYKDVHSADECLLVLNVNDAWYYGSHELADDYYEGERTPAVVIY